MRAVVAWVVSVVGAAGCGGPRQPHEPASPSTASEPNAAPLATDPEACPRVTHVFLPPSGVGLCTDVVVTRGIRYVSGCFTFDVQARSYAAAPDMTMAVPAPEPPPARAHVHGGTVEACGQNQGRCTTIAPRDIAAGAAAVNAQATRLVVFPRDGRTAELWDLDVIQRLATIPLRTANCERHAEFLADALLLVEAVSCERGATQLGTLFDDRGKYLAAVGGPDFDLAGVQPMPAGGTMWTFLSEDRVAIHDLASGAMRGPFDLSGGAHWDRAWFTELPGGPLVGVSLGGTPGRIAIIDGAGAVEQFDPPTCPR